MVIISSIINNLMINKEYIRQLKIGNTIHSDFYLSENLWEGRCESWYAIYKNDKEAWIFTFNSYITNLFTEKQK